MMYKIIAFLILLTFYCCYIIKMLQQKKDGIQTNHLGKGKTGFPKMIEILLKISSYLIVAVEIISIITYNGNINIAIRIAGIIISILGTVVFIKAVVDMKNNWRAGVSEKDNTNLVTNGIYEWSRNPAFLGFYLTYIGILLSFFNVFLLIVSTITIIIFHLQIVNVEEDYLIAHFGQDYIDYKKAVNRYLGKNKQNNKF